MNDNTTNNNTTNNNTTNNNTTDDYLEERRKGYEKSRTAYYENRHLHKHGEHVLYQDGKLKIADRDYDTVLKVLSDDPRDCFFGCIGYEDVVHQI